jgi:hypothetical protein
VFGFVGCGEQPGGAKASPKPASDKPVAASADQGGGKASFAFREVNGTGLELSDNGTPVFVYNFGMMLASGFPETMQRSCYLHPVYAPDGTLISDDFNQDHPHHRGISWMWPEVTVDGKKGDIWMVKEFRQKFIQWKARDAQPTQARLAVENGWFEGDRQFVKENVEIIVHPVAKNQRTLDFTLSFEAIDKPVQIAGTPEGKKGFGGFCFRFLPRDGGETATVITTDKGIAAKDEVMKPHAWAQVSGKFSGKAAGGRIDDDPANPGYPNGWLLRHKFGFLNVSYPGVEPITLQPGKPLVLKYRVSLFAGDAS